MIKKGCDIQQSCMLHLFLLVLDHITIGTIGYALKTDHSGAEKNE